MNTTPRRAAAVAAGAFTTLAVVASTLLGGMAAAADAPELPETPAMAEVVALEAPAEVSAEAAAPEPAAVVEAPAAPVEAPTSSAGDDAQEATLTIGLRDLGAPLEGSVWIYQPDGDLQDYAGFDGVGESFEIPAGSYFIKAQSSAPGYMPQWWGGAPGTSNSALLEIAPGEDRTVEIELARISPIRGTVMNLDGTPATGYEIILRNAGGSLLHSAEVGATGQAATAAIAGDHLLEVRDPDGASLGYWNGTSVLATAETTFGVTNLGTEIQFHIVLGAVAEEPDPCVDPITREPIPCDEPEEPEHCDGEYDGSEYDCQDPTEECDPTRENCGDPNEDCNPLMEDCGDPNEECNPAVERCHEGEECNPLMERCEDGHEECEAWEDCDEHETETYTETELETLALTGAPIAAVALTASALLLGGLIVLAARRRQTA